jgi:hypothetical protein
MDDDSIKMCKENEFDYEGKRISYYDFIVKFGGVKILKFDELADNIAKIDKVSEQRVRSIYKTITSPIIHNEGTLDFPKALVADFLKMIFLFNGNEAKPSFNQFNVIYDLDLFNSKESAGALYKAKLHEMKSKRFSVSLLMLFVEAQKQIMILEHNQNLLPLKFLFSNIILDVFLSTNE